jgi:protein-disulfide isomerase
MNMMKLTGLMLAAALTATACGQPAPPPAPAPVEAPKVAAPTANVDAKIEIIEFSDFECPFCSRVNPTLARIKDELKKDVIVTFMHQPLPFHQNAKRAAIAAEAARRQGKFQEFHDAMFQDQKALDAESLLKIATTLKLDLEKYKADVADPTLAKVVDRHQAIANAVGASGTPAFFINGKNIKGAQPYEKFKEIITVELEEANKAKQQGETWLKERLKVNNAALYDYVYGGKEPPPNVPKKAPVDKTVYKVDVNAEDAIEGPAEALVTMVVFSEYECPFCAKVEPTLSAIMAKYPGKVRRVFKHSPLPFHQNARGASVAAMCAQDQGKFWQYGAKLFANQKALKAEDLELYATQEGLDVAAFKACVTSDKHNARIDADLELAAKVTARGTPNVFINGRKVQGAKPEAEFVEIVDEELKKAEAIVAKGIAPNAVYAEIIKNGKVFEPLEEKVNAFNLDNSAILGKKTAKIVIVEFSDFQCPFCSRVGAPLKDLKAKYGDDLAVVFKHFPLDFHKEAKPAALASMCANDQGKFWPYHDELFANQKALLEADLKTYATKIGLDMAKWEACVKEGRHNALIDAEIAEGRQAGVRGTPTLFINGRKLNAPGGYTVDSMSGVINKYILGKPAEPKAVEAAPKAGEAKPK